MAKKSRPPLYMADGAEVRNLETLREHFDLETVLEYYKSGKLLTWLQNRYFDDEAAAVEELDEQSPDFQQKLCEIFGVEYTGNAVDLEEISKRQERLERLRTFTDEAEFIEHIDQVAFDQEELADLLDEEETTIYLCGEKFTVPSSRKGVKYVGINSPKVHISGKLPENVNEQGIEFSGCDVDNLPNLDKQDSPSFDINEVTGEFIDEINFGKGTYGSLKAIQETDHYIVYVRRAYKDNEGCSDPMILFDKRTGQKRRFPKKFPRFNTGLTDGDRVFYFERDEYKSSSSEGDIWTFDLNALTFPQKLFPLHYDEEKISVCNGHVAYVDGDNGPFVYNLKSKAISKIPVEEGTCQGIYAVLDGVYFSVNNYPTYTMNFYDYATKKTYTIFQTGMEILKIYHVENGDKFYCLFYNHHTAAETDSRVVGVVNYNYNGDNGKEKLEPSEVFDVMGTAYTIFNTVHMEGDEVHSYHDGMIFVAKGGVIKYADYQTGELKEISADASEHHYDSGGLFKKASSWDTAVSFHRIGNWIIYPLNGDYNKMRRVSLERPGEIEFIQEIDDIEKEMQFFKATYDIPEISLA